jgi:hypothetical protein
VAAGPTPKSSGPMLLNGCHIAASESPPRRVPLMRCRSSRFGGHRSGESDFHKTFELSARKWCVTKRTRIRDEPGRGSHLTVDFRFVRENVWQSEVRSRVPTNGSLSGACQSGTYRRIRPSQKRYELLKNGPMGSVTLQRKWPAKPCSPQSAGVLDTDLHMICLIGQTCSTPTSFWFRPP